jgi:hypothetical protein
MCKRKGKEERERRETSEISSTSKERLLAGLLCFALLVLCASPIFKGHTENIRELVSSKDICRNSKCSA